MKFGNFFATNTLSGQVNAALFLHRLYEHFSELNLDVVNNSNIKVKHVRLKGLHLTLWEKVDLL